MRIVSSAKTIFPARACVRSGFFTRRPVAENVHRTWGYIYIYVYNIPCRVWSGQKITPTVIYCRGDTYYSLLQTERVQCGWVGWALSRCPVYTLHGIRGRRGRFSFVRYYIIILSSVLKKALWSADFCSDRRRRVLFRVDEPSTASAKP